MAHPLREYIEASGDTLTGFAARAGVSRRTLSRIISGERAPSPEVARRIAEAAGGAAPFEALLGAGRVADLAARRPEEDGVDAALLAPVLRFALAGIAEEEVLTDDIVETAAEAVASAHDAMARVTTRTGEDRLLQVLEPVFREIAKDCPELSLPAEEIAGAARSAAALYFRAKPPRP